MKKILTRLKDKLTEKEYFALQKAMTEIKAPHVPTRFDVCFACRYDITLAYSIVNTLRNNITDSLSLCEYVASVKTLYLTDRNNRQNAECSYSVEGDLLLLKQALLTATANAHRIIKLTTETDVLTICKAIKMFDDLKFFASELKEIVIRRTFLGVDAFLDAEDMNRKDRRFAVSKAGLGGFKQVAHHHAGFRRGIHAIIDGRKRYLCACAGIHGIQVVNQCFHGLVSGAIGFLFSLFLCKGLHALHFI